MRVVIGFLVLCFVVFFGCDQPRVKKEQLSHNASQEVVKKVAKPAEEKPDVSEILKQAVELREEKVFLVTLKFKKEQLTLDIFKHIGNEMTAEYRTIVVGERTFNEYKEGEEVSSVGDGLGLLFKGEIAEYVVQVYEKKVKSKYFWIDSEGNQVEISRQEHEEVLNQLSKTGRQFITVPFSGVVRTYILEKPLTEYEFVSRQPLKRYFVTVLVENRTFTFDLIKHARNAANTHEITIEVPRQVYEKTGDLWDVQLSQASFMIKGHLSELQGKVIKKWTEVDNDYELVKTKKGRELIVPKEKEEQ